MNALLSPFSDLVSVASLEARLRADGCVKVGRCTSTECLWRAPNGRHLSAPNPEVYSLVPPDALETEGLRPAVTVGAVRGGQRNARTGEDPIQPRKDQSHAMG